MYIYIPPEWHDGDDRLHVTAAVSWLHVQDGYVHHVYLAATVAWPMDGDFYRAEQMGVAKP
jgi:hypothetical protein